MGPTSKHFLQLLFLASAVFVPWGMLRAAPEVAHAEAAIAGSPAEVSFGSSIGFVVLYRGNGSQVAILGNSSGFVADVARGEEIDLKLAFDPGSQAETLEAVVTANGLEPAQVRLSGGEKEWNTVRRERRFRS